MRLGHYDLQSIVNNILQDLYKKAEDEFSERRTEIARQNRDYYLAPLLPILEQLPLEMVGHHMEYKVQVKYGLDPHTGNFALDEVWVYRSTGGCVINPRIVDSTRSTWEIEAAHLTKLDSRLYAEAHILIMEILAIQKEKAEMNHLLYTTTKQYSGSLQLRKVWPNSLHKYLPAEPPKATKAPRSTAVLAPKQPTTAVIPTSLNNRLTTNLLES